MQQRRKWLLLAHIIALLNRPHRGSTRTVHTTLRDSTYQMPMFQLCSTMAAPTHPHIPRKSFNHQKSMLQRLPAMHALLLHGYSWRLQKTPLGKQTAVSP
jgi:hypothetical protein